MILLNHTDNIKYQDQKVYINKTSYICNIPEEIWDYQLGGHKPCQLWLKQRKGRHMNEEDYSSYSNILSIIASTIGIVREIDLIE